MNVRFLILCLAVGLLAAGGCSKAYETTVVTNSYGSPDFSAFHTFAHSGMRDRGLEIPASRMPRAIASMSRPEMPP